MTLIQTLHNFPRYTFSFRRLKVDSGTAASNWNDYSESLIFFVVAPVCMCVVFIMFDITFQICLKCRNEVPTRLIRSATDELKVIRTHRRRFLLSVLLGMIDIVLLCIAINWNFDLTEGVQQADDIVLHIQDYQTRLQNNGSQTKNLIKYAKNNITQFLKLRLPNDIHNSSLDVEQNLKYAIIAANQFVFQTSNSTIPKQVQSVFNAIQSDEATRSDMTAAIFFLFFCCLFFVLCSDIVCKCPPCCNCFLTSFNYWVYLASWAIIGFHFALSIGIADICYNPEEYLRNISEKVFLEPEQSIVSYYLYCNDQQKNNPLRQYLILGAQRLNETVPFIPVFQNYSKHHMEAQGIIDDWIQWTYFSAKEFENIISYDLDCNDIHSHFATVKDNLCKKSLPQVFLLFMYHAIACAIYSVALCMLSIRRVEEYNEYSYYAKSNLTIGSAINGDTNQLRLLSEGTISADIGGEVDSDVDFDFGQVAAAAANISAQKKRRVFPFFGRDSRHDRAVNASQMLKGAFSSWKNRFSMSDSRRTSTDTSEGTSNYGEYDYSDLDDNGMPRQKRLSSSESNNESDNDEFGYNTKNRIANLLDDNREYSSESDT